MIVFQILVFDFQILVSDFLVFDYPIDFSCLKNMNGCFIFWFLVFDFDFKINKIKI